MRKEQRFFGKAMRKVDFNKLMDVTIGKITLGHIFAAIITFVIGYIIARILLKIINGILDKSKIEKTLNRFLKIVIKCVVYFMLAVIVIDSLGISATSLVAVFSVFGLAISLAAQNSLSNFAGGVLLMVFKPFAVDDYVEVAGRSGTINEIGLIYTKLTTFDNKVIYIPNSDISSKDIVNYTKQEKRRVDLKFNVSYEIPIPMVKKAILEAVDAVSHILPEPAPFVNVAEYKESSIEYVVRVWTKTEDYWDVYNKLIEEVKDSFDRNHVEMTYNHLNVHVIEK